MTPRPLDTPIADMVARMLAAGVAHDLIVEAARTAEMAVLAGMRRARRNDGVRE